MHSFESCLEDGLLAEKELDAYLIDKGWVKEFPLVELNEDRRGIDRIAVLANGQRRSLQYKADWRAGETGNGFIEIISNDQIASPGWALTLCADVLLYWAPTMKSETFSNLLFIKSEDLRPAVGKWLLQNHGMAPAFNQHYRTLGIKLPWMHLQSIASHEDDLYPSEETDSRHD